MSKLVAVKLLIFSVSQSKYFVIYSEKNAPFLGKFSSRDWSAPGSLFCLSLIAKSCAGDKVAFKLAFDLFVLVFIFILCKQPFLGLILVFGFHSWLFCLLEGCLLISILGLQTHHVNSMWNPCGVFVGWRIVTGPPVIGLFGCYYFFCHS